VFDAAPDAEIGWLTSRVQHLQEQDQMEEQNKTDKVHHQDQSPEKTTKKEQATNHTEDRNPKQTQPAY